MALVLGPVQLEAIRHTEVSHRGYARRLLNQAIGQGRFREEPIGSSRMVTGRADLRQFISSRRSAARPKHSETTSRQLLHQRTRHVTSRAFAQFRPPPRKVIISHICRLPSPRPEPGHPRRALGTQSSSHVDKYGPYRGRYRVDHLASDRKRQIGN